MYYVYALFETGDDSEEPSKAADAPAEGDEGDEEEVKPKKPKKVPNQFNFCERAALTYHNPQRVSDPSTRRSFCFLILRIIF